MRAQSQRAWHAMPASSVMDALQVDGAGLAGGEARSRLAEYGPNRLPEPPAAALWKIALRQFASPLIYILVAAAVVSETRT